jgi:hypothetical protein
MRSHTSELYSAWVWIFAALSIFIYSVLGLLGFKLPGVEQLVNWLSIASGWQIYVAAFVSIFIEGLYFIGSFFPGSTLVIIVAILAQFISPLSFLLIIGVIFIGWCLAGVANIFFAKLYRQAVIRNLANEEPEVKDRVWTTWFPAFRANYEVAQITEGGDAWKVFLSSVRVKLWASGAAALYALIIPFFIDITKISNEEGFLSLIIVGLITLAVGVVKLRNYLIATKLPA